MAAENYYIEEDYQDTYPDSQYDEDRSITSQLTGDRGALRKNKNVHRTQKDLSLKRPWRKNTGGIIFLHSRASPHKTHTHNHTLPSRSYQHAS